MTQPNEIEIIPAGQATDLTTLESITPALLFSEGGSKQLLEKIRTEVASVVTDISTKEGRDAVAALAYKVARSKTLLDKIGKTLNADLKAKAAVIDKQRSQIWDSLEAIQKDIRKPLTDWEEKEEARTASHKQALDLLDTLAKFDTPPTTAVLRQRIADLDDLGARDWQEHAEMAKGVIGGTRADLEVRLNAAVKADEDRAELEKLRALQAERDAEDLRRKSEADAAEAEKKRLQDIADAAAVAKQKADEDAAQKVKDAEAALVAAEAKRVQDIKDAEDKAERERIAAAKKAEDDQAAAVEAERKRVADEAEAVRVATLERESNRAHCAKINNAVLDALISLCMTPDDAKKVVEAIALNKIPHTTITY
jgi:colicin import membrane protein